jgi:hypothetical protein
MPHIERTPEIRQALIAAHQGAQNAANDMNRDSQKCRRAALEQEARLRPTKKTATRRPRSQAHAEGSRRIRKSA